jgi:methionyl aminopeptidase
VIIRKSRAELEVMARAGAVVARLHGILREAIAPGMSTAALDALAEREVRSLGAVPSFKGYHGFPATLCTSVNSEIVHGIPSPDVILRSGDVVKIDAGAIVDGYHADAAATWVVGADDDPDVAPPEVHRLVAETRAALWDGMAAARVGGRLGDVSAAVGARGQRGGYGVVRGFVGHGVGRALHEDPEVPNMGQRGHGLRLRAGLVIAVEPMFTLGSTLPEVQADGWTAVTVDGSLAAHWEHTVAVTEEGPRVLTALAGEARYAVPALRDREVG